MNTTTLKGSARRAMNAATEAGWTVTIHEHGEHQLHLWLTYSDESGSLASAKEVIVEQAVGAKIVAHFDTAGRFLSAVREARTYRDSRAFKLQEVLDWIAEPANLIQRATAHTQRMNEEARRNEMTAAATAVYWDSVVENEWLKRTRNRLHEMITTEPMTVRSDSSVTFIPSDVEQVALNLVMNQLAQNALALEGRSWVDRNGQLHTLSLGGALRKTIEQTIERGDSGQGITAGATLRALAKLLSMAEQADACMPD